MDDPLDNNGGNGTVYELAAGVSGNNNPSTLRSEDFMDGGIYRNGQAVAAKDGLTSVGSGTWTVGDDFLQFTLDGISSFNPGLYNFGLHWTMYCANDVIEGHVSVPEPDTISLSLLGLGLLGLRRVRQQEPRSCA